MTDLLILAVCCSAAALVGITARAKSNEKAAIAEAAQARFDLEAAEAIAVANTPPAEPPLPRLPGVIRMTDEEQARFTALLAEVHERHLADTALEQEAAIERAAARIDIAWAEMNRKEGE